MALATRGDVEKFTGCALTASEEAALPLMLGALEAEITAAVGSLGVAAGDEITFYPAYPINQIHVASPLTDLTSVTVNGSAVTVSTWTTSGVITLADTIEAGAEVVVTRDHGAAVPDNVKLLVATKIAAAIRAGRTATIVGGNTAAWGQSKTIGSTTISNAAPTSDMVEWLAAGGTAFLTLTEDERRKLRRQFGRLATSTTVR